MNRYNIIQEIIKAINAQTYVEVGVNRGDIFFGVKSPRKIAVDPYFEFSLRFRLRRMRLVNMLLLNNSEHFYEMTSDEFFKNENKVFADKKIDVAFIDGLHTYQQVYRDIINSLFYLNPSGVIIVHDCNPPASANATPVISSMDEVLVKAKKGEVPGWTGNWAGDVWKAIVRLRSERDDLSIHTLDIDWGVAIIMNEKNQTELPFSLTDIDKMTYTDLAANREQWLNLKEPLYLKTIISKLTGK